MNDRKQAEVLLRAAERDVKTLLLIGDAPDLDEVVGFHAQQAAEKLINSPWQKPRCIRTALHPGCRRYSGRIGMETCRSA